MRDCVDSLVEFVTPFHAYVCTNIHPMDQYGVPRVHALAMINYNSKKLVRNFELSPAGLIAEDRWGILRMSMLLHTTILGKIHTKRNDFSLPKHFPLLHLFAHSNPWPYVKYLIELMSSWHNINILGFCRNAGGKRWRLRPGLFISQTYTTLDTVHN